MEVEVHLEFPKCIHRKSETAILLQKAATETETRISRKSETKSYEKVKKIKKQKKTAGFLKVAGGSWSDPSQKTSLALERCSLF